MRPLRDIHRQWVHQGCQPRREARHVRNHLGEGHFGADLTAGPVDIPRPLRPRDQTVVSAATDVISAHTYDASWYNNATFVFPFLAAAGAGIVGGVTRSLELLGLAGFLAVVTLLMLPLVYTTWRRTPTVVILRRERIESLHQGRPMLAFPWSTITGLRRVETMGNVRWYVVGNDGSHLTLDGEIADLDGLLERARTLAGLDESAPSRG